MRKKLTERVTITDVAHTAGVSKTTVSRYLSGQYHILSENARNRIQEAIRELNYRPNQMARGLKQDRSYLIGMVIADITNPFSTAILRGAEDVCKQRGYSIMVCNTDNDPAKEREYIFMLQSRRIDGLLINTTGRNNQFLRQLAEEHTAIVLVDRKVPELGLDTVGVDNELSTKEAIRFMINRGYEQIAFFTEPLEGVSTRQERANAFKDILIQYGFPVADLYEADLQQAEPLLKQLERFLESSREGKRAIFAANGVILLKLIHALKHKGLRIPDDVAIAGFDEMEWTDLIGPGITTVSQPTYQIGVTAMERIFRRLEGDHSPSQNIAFAGKLIIRGSTPSVKGL
ncbi:LacI family DNA-binding transcriptional regulator [Paenactinomyces guangxiensis]|uniref:LacI family DNA-binding transcriptional regulator n=1 Tax=Paenactinomyces guangxiensis TaxID=1490290 RepID=A0A7W1WNQ6_9BACL|nr:LacI family DNA-binding transcriptional regulator [Paenactinomyces guangxiensis]MBA4493185.1 LacI family DNA-binding transcriptional regulator [Paenactinomyces guangxiensis]MBH8589965.1 LacI family DNA-binding transcriptional regulator [Paenactinomyces guangxiensis]